ncbi:MAG: hypothetical protein RL211_1885 [Pseudomonadota bacterium]|jgi:hypothetical protein
MKLKNILFYMLFMPSALTNYAQTAINSGANNSAQSSITSTLPLRNLSIEVRQINQISAEQAGISARGNIRLRPNASSANVDVNAQQNQQSSNTNTLQQVLVLNGRRVAVGLRSSVPLRLVQAVIQNGVLVIVPGTVLLESGTGFDAIARWEGGDLVELELDASQGKGAVMSQTTSTATSLMVPVGEWITVAHSDTQGSGRWSSQALVQVQLRVNIR